MDREWYWRGGFFALLTLGALYLLVPSAYYFSLPADTRNDAGALAAVLPSWAPEKKLNLGLDLQGGIHLVMEVDVDAALRAKAANRATEIEDQLAKDGIAGVTARVVEKDRVEVTIPKDKVDAARKLFVDWGDMEEKSNNNGVLVLAFLPAQVRELKDGAVQQSIKAIRNRIDKFGVSEPTIARRGTNHILVQLPGFKDPSQAKELIGRTAQLEFRMVDDNPNALDGVGNVPDGIQFNFDGSDRFLQSNNQKALADFLEDKAPAGRTFALGRIERMGEQTMWRSWVVEDKAALTGAYLTDARVQFGGDALNQKPSVGLTFNRRGADLFEKLTGDNVGKRMAIVLDGVVDSAPVIQDRISGGSAQITMGGYRGVNETLQEAQNLALVLKAGALPAPVTIAEQRSVGASLGPELISSGMTALGVGTLLVVLFMLLYYRLTGAIADVALLLNALFIFAALALFGASLTLPGIAGIVLTLGMAVDANIIINERIREELLEGKSARTAVIAGYDKAFSAILDANVTTVIAGVVMLQYGTGPIKGFAVTLIIGIIASMFTSIVITRWFMDLVVAKKPNQLSI